MILILFCGYVHARLRVLADHTGSFSAYWKSL